MDATSLRQRVLISGGLLGMGIGGFFDGIVLHQILQWHHMLSSTEDHPTNTIAGLETNVLWDGLFHAATYIFTVAGLIILWRVLSDVSRSDSPIQWSTKGYIGAILTGWGLFNVVEGSVNHHLLGIHHVREGDNEVLWDLGFLAWGVGMIAFGIVLSRAVPSPLEGRVGHHAELRRGDQARP